MQLILYLDGEAATDVAYNFLQRWNHHRDELTYWERYFPLAEGSSKLYPVIKPLPNLFHRSGLYDNNGSDIRLTHEQQLRLGGMSWAAKDQRWRRHRELLNELRFDFLVEKEDAENRGFEDPRHEADRQHHGLLTRIKKFLKRPFSHISRRNEISPEEEHARSFRRRRRARTAAVAELAQTDQQKLSASEEVPTGVNEPAEEDQPTPVHSAVVISTIDETTGDVQSTIAVQHKSREDKGKGKLGDDEDYNASLEDRFLPEMLMSPERIADKERERIAQLVRETGWDVNRILTQECRLSSPEPYTQVLSSRHCKLLAAFFSSCLAQMTAHPVACSVQIIRSMSAWSGAA